MATADSIDLSRLGLESGAAFQADLDVKVEPYIFGGEKYPVAGGIVSVHLDVVRTTSGYVFRVRAKTQLTGPCMRCFDPIDWAVKVDAREIHEPTLDPEAVSEYVSPNKELDLASWLRDAIGLALPPTISGPLDADDRCTLCDRTLDELGLAAAPPAEDDTGPDPRWSKLRDLDL